MIWYGQRPNRNFISNNRSIQSKENYSYKVWRKWKKRFANNDDISKGFDEKGNLKTNKIEWIFTELNGESLQKTKIMK